MTVEPNPASDQLLATFDEVDRYHSPAAAFFPQLQRKVDYAYHQHLHSPTRTSVAPVVSRSQSFYEAGSSWAPLVISSGGFGMEMVARSPLTLRETIDNVVLFPDSRCGWHNGYFPAGSRHFLSVAKGQFLVLFPVCSRCRRKVQRDCPRGLCWWDLEECSDGTWAVTD